MTLAELLLFAAAIAGVYLALVPLRRFLERRLLSWMGRDPGRPGQGHVFTIKRERDPPRKKED